MIAGSHESMWFQVSSFLSHEARLADEYRVAEWLDLWVDSDDSTYWISASSSAEGPEPGSELAVVYDRLPKLRDRMSRLTMPGAHSLEPRGALLRIVANVEVSPGEDGTVQAWCNFVLHQWRRTDRILSGRSSYLLKTDESGAIRIARKNVALTNAEGGFGTLAFIL